MALTKNQIAALQNVFDNGILDHDAEALEALKIVLADLKNNCNTAKKML
ncbi:hypothetical protein HFP47_01940 [Leuconostoc sp. DB-1]|nr:hypothetical protein [Leuconostoc sp. DB-1]NYS21837.1 hypothetical protein [Leuconostoc sp. DB-1]